MCAPLSLSLVGPVKLVVVGPGGYRAQVPGSVVGVAAYTWRGGIGSKLRFRPGLNPGARFLNPGASSPSVRVDRWMIPRALISWVLCFDPSVWGPETRERVCASPCRVGSPRLGVNRRGEVE